MALPPLLRLMRPALAPTAAADVVAAAAIAGGAPVLTVAAAALGSVCLYTAGMVHNDLADRKRDATLHPDRPLITDPSLTTKALFLAVFLFAAGIALCIHAGAQWPALAVFAIAVGYNLGLKARFPADAVALGCARASNLGIGIAAAGGEFEVTYLLGYALFIFGITAASRAEDCEPPARRRKLLFLAQIPMILGIGAFVSLATRTRAVFLLPAVVFGLLFLRAFWAGTREANMRYVLHCLLGIFLIHAASLGTRGHPLALIPIAVLASLSFLLLGAARRPAT